MDTLLIAGNTGAISESGYKRLSKVYRVILVGEDVRAEKKREGIVRFCTNFRNEDIRKIFDAYTIDSVIYISENVDNTDKVRIETDELELFYRYCGKYGIKKSIVLISKDGCNYTVDKENEMMNNGMEFADERALAAWQLEQMIRFQERMNGHKSTVLRCPFIFREGNEDAYLGKLLAEVRDGKEIALPYSEDTQLDIIHETDLLRLCRNILEEGVEKTRFYNVGSGYVHRWKELEEKIKCWNPEAKLIYENRKNYLEEEEFPRELRSDYGFVPERDVMESLDACYQEFEKEPESVKKSAKEPVKELAMAPTSDPAAAVKDAMNSKTQVTRKQNDNQGILDQIQNLYGKISGSMNQSLLSYLEVIFFFFVSEWISRYTSESVYFRFVDVRLLYIVIMGTIHGLRCGILSAILSSISLARKYGQIGMGGILMFYHVDNWIPFVCYLMVGFVTGFMQNRHKEEKDFAQKEYQLLRDKYLFLNDVYRGSIDKKTEYKKQVLGFTDSYGKIYSAVQNLDCELPQKVFQHGLHTLEDILDNKSVAIYTLSDDKEFALLSAHSTELLDKIPKKYHIHEIPDIYDVVKKKKVWKNVEMIPDYPVYASAIFDGDQPVVLIMIYSAKPEQMNVRYMNLLQILCGLIQTALLRAVRVQELRGQYYPETSVIYPELFKEILDIYYKMEQSGNAQYAVLALEEHDMKKVSEELPELIYSDDVIGADENGNLYLLLVEVNEQNLSAVVNRLRKNGIKFKVLEDKGRSWF